MYLLGGVHGEDRAAIEDHLARCAGCLREADVLGPAVEALAALDAEDAAEFLAGREVVPEAPPAPVRRSGRRRPGRWGTRYRNRTLLAIAALGGAVVLTTGTMLDSRSVVAGTRATPVTPQPRRRSPRQTTRPARPCRSSSPRPRPGRRRYTRR